VTRSASTATGTSSTMATGRGSSYTSSGTAVDETWIALRASSRFIRAGASVSGDA
jgi:hypothetical protein